jgi:glycosyltransferase involved in cell wall biosynthesis
MNTKSHPPSETSKILPIEESALPEKLRILAVTNTYPTPRNPDNSPQIRDQIEALRERGVEVDLMYIDIHKGKWSYAQAAWKILLLSFKRERYDLIHAYYGHCGLLARLQAKYPIIVTFLGSDLLDPRDGMIGKPVARFADGVIVQSEEMKRVSKRDDAGVIPFGVNMNLFKPYPMEKARCELGLALDEKLILFPWNPARMVKRFDLIQEAVRIVQQKFDGVRLIPVFDQPHETVSRYMNACNVMVLASLHEGSPVALREAMACNLPIVSVDVGDVRSIIKNTEGCYLCEREPSDIAAKVSLALDRGGRTCGASVVGQADAAWAADQIMLLYNSVLKSHPRQYQGETSCI